jgi:hypothetical protein
MKQPQPVGVRLFFVDDREVMAYTIKPTLPLMHTFTGVVLAISIEQDVF